MVVAVVVAIVLEVGGWGISEVDRGGQLVGADDHTMGECLQVTHAARVVDALLRNTALQHSGQCHWSLHMDTGSYSHTWVKLHNVNYVFLYELVCLHVCRFFQSTLLQFTQLHERAPGYGQWWIFVQATFAH